jgi:hypothetical protein
VVVLVLAGQRRERDAMTQTQIHEDGRMVDALAPAADEGRGHAAKCSGEALAAGDPEISEWGNPPGATPGTALLRGARGELKHLSTRRSREDSLSSGERTGRSPNHTGVRASRRCRGGGRTDGWEGATDPSPQRVCQPNATGTGGRSG